MTDSCHGDGRGADDGALDRSYCDERPVIKPQRAVTKRPAMPMRRPGVRLEELPPAEARVLIAEDVLMQLDADKLQATQGVWLSHDDELTSEQFLASTCGVCVIGAIFVAAARRQGTEHFLEVEESGDRGCIAETTNGAFSPAMLRDMEYVFESYDGPYRSALKKLGPDGRLRAIMKSIITHGGTFDALNLIEIQEP